MVENPDFHLRYEKMSPHQRNQELRGLFDMLPDFNAVNILGESTDGAVETIEKSAEQRMTSPFAKSLKERLTQLLKFGFTTNASKAFISRRYDSYLREGITKKEINPHIPELELWGNALRWDLPENGGMFAENEARDIDKALYKHAVEDIVSNRNIAEEVLKMIEGVSDKKFVDAARAFHERKRKLSDFELSLLSYEDRLTTVIVQYRAEEKLEDIRLIERWRGEHIERFGDEP